MLTVIRSERPEDAEAIGVVTAAAFEGAEHSSGTEAKIIDTLRTAGALTLSLVAIDGDEIVGLVAFSPVSIESGATKWFGLGPVSVRPDRQGTGIGKALIEAGIARLKDDGAHGCVVLGDPRYYAASASRVTRLSAMPTCQQSIFSGLYSTDQSRPARSDITRHLR